MERDDDVEVATCGVCMGDNRNHTECCICFKIMCHGEPLYTKDLCVTCANSLPKDNTGLTRHPYTNRPLPACRCGKLFFGDCRLKCLMPSRIFVGPNPENCSPTQNLLNLRNPDYWMTDSEIHGLV